MDKNYSTLPKQDNFEYGHTQAFNLAARELTSILDIRGQCRRCGTQYKESSSTKTITLKYLTRLYRISLPDIKIDLADSLGPAPLKTSVIILHYLTRAKGTPLTGRMISFRELPYGTDYYRTFTKRTIDPLLKHFGKDNLRLVKSAKKLGGIIARYGDSAVTVNAFPYVPITIAMWRGDEEFAPRASLLFDATIGDYLSTEDITVASEALAWMLVRS